MAEEPTAVNPPKLNLNGFVLLDQLGRVVQQAYDLAVATPEWKTYLAAETSRAALADFLGVPKEGLADFRGEIEMVMSPAWQARHDWEQVARGPASGEDHPPVEHSPTEEAQALADMLKQMEETADASPDPD